MVGELLPSNHLFEHYGCNVRVCMVKALNIMNTLVLQLVNCQNCNISC